MGSGRVKGIEGAKSDAGGTAGVQKSIERHWVD